MRRSFLAIGIIFCLWDGVPGGDAKGQGDSTRRPVNTTTPSASVCRTDARDGGPLNGLSTPLLITMKTVDYCGQALTSTAFVKLRRSVKNSSLSRILPTRSTFRA
jgi:hypothetical protein